MHFTYGIFHMHKKHSYLLIHRWNKILKTLVCYADQAVSSANLRKRWVFSWYITEWSRVLLSSSLYICNMDKDWDKGQIVIARLLNKSISGPARLLKSLRNAIDSTYIYGCKQVNNLSQGFQQINGGPRRWKYHCNLPLIESQHWK